MTLSRRGLKSEYVSSISETDTLVLESSFREQEISWALGPPPSLFTRRNVIVVEAAYEVMERIASAVSPWPPPNR